jgi:dienelactone hydrolase
MHNQNTVISKDLMLTVEGRRVPVSVWHRKNISEPRPLVLVGHGGSGHKRSQLVIDAMEPLIQKYHFVVAAIDGPVHGERREVFSDGPMVRQEFRDLWSSGLSIDPMVADWQATIDELCVMPEVNSEKIGWYGISMGTAYGLPLVAHDSRIKAATLGMWGTCRSPSDRLIADAKKTQIPVLFQIKTEDAIFTQQGQVELFELIASKNKILKKYSGGHTDPAGEQLDDIIDFLAKQLINQSNEKEF